MSIAFRVVGSKFWDHLLYQILQRACLWWASLSEWKLCYRPTNYHWRPRTWSLDKRSLKSNPNPAQIELKTNRLHDQIIAKDFLYRPSLIGGDNCNSFVVHYICTKGGEERRRGESRKRVNKYFAQDWRARWRCKWALLPRHKRNCRSQGHIDQLYCSPIHLNLVLPNPPCSWALSIGRLKLTHFTHLHQLLIRVTINAMHEGSREGVKWWWRKYCGNQGRAFPSLSRTGQGRPRYEWGSSISYVQQVFMWNWTSWAQLLHKWYGINFESILWILQFFTSLCTTDSRAMAM